MNNFWMLIITLLLVVIFTVGGMVAYPQWESYRDITAAKTLQQVETITNDTKELQ